MGALHGKINLFNVSSAPAIIDDYMTVGSGIFDKEPEKLPSNGGLAVVTYQSETPFNGSFKVDFGDSGEFLVTITKQYRVYVILVKKPENGKRVKGKVDKCVCVCCNLNCTDVIFSNADYCEGAPPTNPPAKEKRIQYMIANNSAVTGKVVKDSKTIAVPAAGGVIYPHFKSPLVSEFDVEFDGLPTNFKITANYDEGTLNVEPDIIADGIVASSSDSSVSESGVMTAMVRFFPKKKDVYTLYLQFGNETGVNGTITKGSEEDNSEWVDEQTSLGEIALIMIIGEDPNSLKGKFKIKLGPNEDDSFDFTVFYQRERPINVSTPSNTYTCHNFPASINDMTLTGNISFTPVKGPGDMSTGVIYYK